LLACPVRFVIIPLMVLDHADKKYCYTPCLCYVIRMFIVLLLLNFFNVWRLSAQFGGWISYYHIVIYCMHYSCNCTSDTIFLSVQLLLAWHFSARKYMYNFCFTLKIHGRCISGWWNNYSPLPIQTSTQWFFISLCIFFCSKSLFFFSMKHLRVCLSNLLTVVVLTFIFADLFAITKG
jgi:hypothetical protein